MRLFRGRFAIAVGAGVLVSACQTQASFVSKKRDAALASALARGRFDLKCQAATGTVLSSSYVPATESGLSRTVQRATFAIGVAGCDRRATYIVVCPDKTNTCLPAEPSGD